MNSQGLMSDIRRVVLRGNVFALAIAVLMGTALFQLMFAVVEYVAIPFARGVLHESAGRLDLGYYNTPIYSMFRGYALVWGEPLTLAVTVLLAALVMLLSRKRLASPNEEDERIEFEEADLRTCPECLSLIPIAARRCAFCTAPVEPAAYGSQESRNEIA